MTDTQHPPVTVTIGEKTIKWTYGLEQDLLRMVPSLEGLIDAVVGNAFVRDYLVRRTLTPIEGFVTEPDTQLIPPQEVNLTVEQHLELLDWISGHIAYFFVNAPLRLTGLMKKYQAQVLIQSTPSGDGSQT